MTDWLGLEKLSLSASKPSGYIPTPPASLLERVKEFGPIEPVGVAATSFDVENVAKQIDAARWRASYPTIVNQAP